MDQPCVNEEVADGLVVRGAVDLDTQRLDDDVTSDAAAGGWAKEVSHFLGCDAARGAEQTGAEGLHHDGISNLLEGGNAVLIGPQFLNDAGLVVIPEFTILSIFTDLLIVTGASCSLRSGEIRELILGGELDLDVVLDAPDGTGITDWKRLFTTAVRPTQTALNRAATREATTATNSAAEAAAAAVGHVEFVVCGSV